MRLILIAGIMLATVLFLRGGLFGIPAQYAAWRGKRQSERRGLHSGKGGEVMPDEAIEIADKQAIYVRRFDARVRAELKQLVTDQLIEEHRTTVGKRRSDALERVLTYFRARRRRRQIRDPRGEAVRRIPHRRTLRPPRRAAAHRRRPGVQDRPTTRCTACSSSACRT